MTKDPSTFVLRSKSPVSAGTYGDVSFCTWIATVCSAFSDAAFSLSGITLRPLVWTENFNISVPPDFPVTHFYAEILEIHGVHVVDIIVSSVDFLCGPIWMNSLAFYKEGVFSCG